MRFGDTWARLGPWRGGGSVAHLVVAPDVPLPGDAVRHCLDAARAAGYEAVLTSAVGPNEEAPFVGARFTVWERLHLLTRTLEHDPGPPPAVVGRASRRDRPAVLAVDDAAFEPFWRLGKVGLRDALDATPVRQLRVTRPSRAGPITGYAITGRAGSHGYLQRIAVRPEAARQGFGRALVADALHWLWRGGAVRASVNTQRDNDAARSLYESLGFELLPSGLSVLGRAL